MNLERLAKALDYQNNYKEKVAEAVEHIESHLIPSTRPLFGITLGSGLGNLADYIKNSSPHYSQPIIINYSDIPNFPIPGIQGHKGELFIGHIEGVPVIGLNGRTHYYEVANQPLDTGMLHVVFPIHVLAGLGVQNYLATNAAGGLNLHYKEGDIMIIKDHITEKGFPSPLLGGQYNFERVDVDGENVWRFQQMSDAYDLNLRNLLRKAGKKPGSDFKNKVHEGTLITVPGPEYETPAECIFYRKHLKADAVGMSIVPEVIAARNRGMNCVAFSHITNEINRKGINTASHDKVMAVSKFSGVRLSTIVRNFFSLYQTQYLSPSL